MSEAVLIIAFFIASFLMIGVYVVHTTSSNHSKGRSRGGYIGEGHVDAWEDNDSGGCDD